MNIPSPPNSAVIVTEQLTTPPAATVKGVAGVVLLFFSHAFPCQHTQKEASQFKL
jgi:hypothetical protein